ncbi:hypothetical protein G5V59_05915 [Nocardioides sp. W3-2-3]|nr:hypothetical protein [Nocardioides convexus]
MSAENPTERSADGRYRFAMPQPVPSYLVALAVGDLEFRAIGARSGIYAEPSVVEGAAWEFADTEQMIEAAERLYGPYRWGRYDILVLPPSFPYGGMENPRLTFATPTVLAGDRSLVTLIAHEPGALVVRQPGHERDLERHLAQRGLHRLLRDPHRRGGCTARRTPACCCGSDARTSPARSPTRRRATPGWSLDLAGRDPDEGPTKIPYEKGSLFLRTIEAAVGRERFDAFLRAYFDRFAFESMDTASFLAHLTSESAGAVGRHGRGACRSRRGCTAPACRTTLRSSPPTPSTGSTPRWPR